MQKTDDNRILSRGWRFLHKPWGEKIASVRNRWRAATASIPVPMRLPFGAWWLARNDNMGDAVREGNFELAETAFVSRWLRPGMTVLDVGANQGYYTLLASQKVGSAGRVISFEPAPREKKALQIHKRLNRCKNVSIHQCAMGKNETEENLLVVQGRETGCNSLRPPIVPSETSALRVRVTRLDDWLSRQRIDHVDFIKLDVEGGELDVLRGAEQLLQRKPRPVILAEVQDVRTEPWGYRAREVLELLAKREYQWFQLTQEGLLAELDLSPNDFDGNFVAVPEERLSQVQEMIKDGSRGTA